MIDDLPPAAPAPPGEANAVAASAPASPSSAPGAAAELEALRAEVDRYAHGRVPRALRRRQVLAVAESLFVERGYDATSMEQIARRVGVTKPVIYDLFASKDDLAATIMGRLADEQTAKARTAIDAAPDHVARMAAGALAFFTFVREHWGPWYALLASDTTPVPEVFADLRTRQTEIVCDLLAEAARLAGAEVAPAQDVLEATARVVTGAYDALAIWWRDHPEAHAERLAELVTALVGPGIAALGSDPAATTPLVPR